MQEHNTLSEKRKHLQAVADTLSAEFAGLDTVITQVMDAVAPWYLMPEWHRRPVIVNLWGMTGTGKSSLVHRLSELLDFKDKTFHVDPNAYENTEVFSEIRNRLNRERMILVFDEFQNFRTLDDELHENKRGKNAIWDILDSGRFSELNLNYNIFELQMTVYRMRQSISLGIEVETGVVTRQQKLFTEIMGESRHRASDEPLWFLPPSIWNILGEFEDQYVVPTTLKKFLTTHTDIEILNELDRIIAKAKRPVEIDCSRALIFVIGNLDEAYREAGYMRKDMHADAFHAATKRIGVIQIKSALRNRFRAEQIARLGNIHIIYPALSAASFYAIIDRELEQVALHLKNDPGVRLTFDDGVREILYKEGVYPAQGARPLLSTIKSVLWSAVSHFAVYVKQEGRKKWKLHWDGVNNQWLFVSEKKCFRYAYIPESQRTEKKALLSGDRKLIAVHEAGHMLGMIALLGEVPDQVYNNAHNGSLHGEVHHRKDETLLTMEVVINTVAMALGGWVAEGIVFGNSERTLGSYSDLEFATTLVLDALKTSGVDHNPYSMRSVVEDTHPNRILDRAGILDTRAKEIIDTACARMSQCIHENETLYRMLVLAVEANQYLNRSDIEALLDDAGYLPQQSLVEKLSIEREQAFQRMFGELNNIQAA